MCQVFLSYTQKQRMAHCNYIPVYVALYKCNDYIHVPQFHACALLQNFTATSPGTVYEYINSISAVKFQFRINKFTSNPVFCWQLHLIGCLMDCKYALVARTQLLCAYLCSMSNFSCSATSNMFSHTPITNSFFSVPVITYKASTCSHDQTSASHQLFEANSVQCSGRHQCHNCHCAIIMWSQGITSSTTEQCCSWSCWWWGSSVTSGSGLNNHRYCTDRCSTSYLEEKKVSYNKYMSTLSL